MMDTTFWPDAAHAARLARSYGPNAEKTGLVEVPLSQLKRPLDRHEGRFPMPAGGLFSTANDAAVFCRMLLNDGELEGRRYLSVGAVAELRKRQTPSTVKESYGLGAAVGGDFFGHGGAHSTHMESRPEKGVVTVWMVQHGGFPGDGATAADTFRKWALERAVR